MVHFKLLGSDALPLSLALVFSTLLTIVITAIVVIMLNKKLPQNIDREGSIGRIIVIPLYIWAAEWRRTTPQKSF